MHVARELVPRYARLQCAVKRLQRSKTIFNVDGWAAGVVVEVRVRVYRGVDVLCVGERSREGCILG